MKAKDNISDYENQSMNLIKTILQYVKFVDQYQDYDNENEFYQVQESKMNKKNKNNQQTLVSQTYQFFFVAQEETIKPY